MLAGKEGSGRKDVKTRGSGWLRETRSSHTPVSQTSESRQGTGRSHAGWPRLREGLPWWRALEEEGLRSSEGNFELSEVIGWVSLVRMYFVLSGSLPPVVSVFLSVGWHADGTGHRERDIDVVGFPPTLVCFPADKRLACLAVCHRTRRSIKTEHCARTGGNRRSGRRILDSTLLRKMEAAESLASNWRRGRDQTAGCGAHHQSIVAASGWRYWPRSPRLPPGRAGAQLDRRAAMDGGLGCRVDVVLSYFVPGRVATAAPGSS